MRAMIIGIILAVIVITVIVIGFGYVLSPFQALLIGSTCGVIGLMTE